jgi:hypothetical protein
MRHGSGTVHGLSNKTGDRRLIVSSVSPGVITLRLRVRRAKGARFALSFATAGPQVYPTYGGVNLQRLLATLASRASAVRSGTRVVAAEVRI